MTKIISFISRKGGTGKTTNAINLATYLAKKKNNIILVETDPNYTINSLRKLELFKLKKKDIKFYNTPVQVQEDDGSIENIYGEIQFRKGTTKRRNKYVWNYRSGFKQAGSR